jgi:ornithine carbamoyltransferase
MTSLSTTKADTNQRTATVRHFLSLFDLSAAEIIQILDRADILKQQREQGTLERTCVYKNMAMIFEKSSTRTRVSFEAGMAELGGHALFLSSDSTQLGRGEPICDSARVISSMVDVIMIRTFAHTTVEELAAFSSVPVINALTDYNHPCQLLADLQTIRQQCDKPFEEISVAWIGDGNNMCNSYLAACIQLGFQLNIATPKTHQPDQELIQKAGNKVMLTTDAKLACQNVDIVTTDTWISMGQEDEKAQRREIFRDYLVDSTMMELADNNATFLHCLPAYRGEEVTDEVMESTQSSVFQQAENRLHAQKALIEFLLNKIPN